jgi:tape measure domain-containing protein
MAESRQLQIIIEAQNNAKKQLDNISSQLSGIEKSSNKAGMGFAGMAKNIAGVAASFISFKKIYDGFKLGITVAADLQTAEVGLTTLLGSSEKASETIVRLKEEAKRTPFELPGLTQATQLLTSITKDGDKSIDIILDVGEGLAAMGKGQAELDRIIVNLQQIASVGRASTLDVKQFAFAGIPIYEMLSEATGKYGEDLQNLISDGGVTFELLTEMFDKANDSGGRFFGAFENQSGTFNQALSNLKDSIGIFFAELVEGSGIFDGLTQAMTRASDWLGNYKENIEKVKEKVSEFLTQIDQNTGFITLLRDAWESVVSTFQERLLPALIQLWTSLEPFKPLLELLAKILGGVLLVALTIVVKTIQVGLNVAINILTTALQIANGVIYAFKAAWDGVVSTIKMVVDWVQKAINKIRELNVLQNVKEKVSNFFGGGRATGGPVKKGTSYLVGENGPELFTPSSNGSIIPNSKLRGASVGGGTSINITVNGDVSGEELVNKVGEVLMSQLRLNGQVQI